MATKVFGSHDKPAKTANDYSAELYEIIGARFPLSLKVENGKMTGVSYETEWQEGTTTPVDTGKVDDNGNPIIDYKENYTKRKLTAAQIKKVDAYIKKNIAE